MRYFLGETEQVLMQTQPMTTEEAAAKQTALFSQASSIAESSVNRTLETAGKLASSAEVQQFIREQGLEPYLRDVTQDRVKNVLSLFGLWYLTKVVRSKYALYGAGALAVYVLFLNRNKLVDKVAQKVSA